MRPCTTCLRNSGGPPVLPACCRSAPGSICRNDSAPRHARPPAVPAARVGTGVVVCGVRPFDAPGRGLARARFIRHPDSGARFARVADLVRLERQATRPGRAAPQLDRIVQSMRLRLMAVRQRGTLRAQKPRQAGFAGNWVTGRISMRCSDNTFRPQRCRARLPIAWHRRHQPGPAERRPPRSASAGPVLKGPSTSRTASHGCSPRAMAQHWGSSLWARRSCLF